MQPSSSNPLAKHFRQPSIYLTLPSNGSYWPNGSLELTHTGQVAVYPMTTRDEIVIRTPDALLNGEGVINVIQSCCPQIKDAWKMPSIDVDAVLVAIRIASYGQNMDIDTVCPNTKCNHENTHTLDLSTILDSIRSPNYNSMIEIQDLKIKLKPQSYFENNKNNMLNFEQDRLLQAISNESLSDDERVAQFNIHLQKMVDINNEIITSGTDYILTEEGDKVTDFKFILEFYENADNRVAKAVKDKFSEFSKSSELPKPTMLCSECETEYPVAISFDYSRFFVNAS